MNSRSLIFMTLLLSALLVALPEYALASTSLYVDGVGGNDSNTCLSPTTACKTIGHAISLASSGASIVVAPGTYSENLWITINLRIIGSSASTTIIDGQALTNVIAIPGPAQVTLSNLTIRNGYHQFGAGIYNQGQLTINASTVTGNSAWNRTICCAYGGGIYNGSSATLTINNSTISANSAGHRYCGFFPCPGSGGGIENGGKLVISNSTVSGNSAYGVQNSTNGRGGGISNEGSMTISNSTISGNSGTPMHGGGIYGGGVFQNSIVANNTGQNCSTPLTSNGYNLSSDGTCNFNSAGDLNNRDPLLGPLQNNGGTTQTMALLPGSPAIDAGNPAGCKDAQGNLLTTDQRGMPRPDKEDTTGCDMGAYESQSDVVPGLNVSPSSLSFGDQPIGSTSTETLTLTNGGSTSISDISLTVSSLFNLSVGTCRTALAADANCVIGIGFTPTGLGTAVGTLTISSSSPTNPTLTVPLSGTGIGTVPSLAPSSLSFGNVLAGTISPPQTATLTNVGNAPLTIVSMVYNDNAPGGLFLSFHTATCAPNLSVAPGSSCTISIEFEANAAASGPQTGSVIVNFVAGGSATLQLSANVIL